MQKKYNVENRYDEVEDEYDGFQEDPISMKVMLLSQIIILAVIFLVGAGLYLWKSAGYKEKFFPGTVINQIPCGNLTVEQVEERLAGQVERYDLTIVFKDDEKIVISGEDIDYEYVSSGEVRKLLKQQNSLKWITGYFKEYEYSVGADMSFDLDKLQNQINILGSEKELFEILPQGAYIHYEDGKFKIIDEVEGNALDDIVFKSAIISAVRSSQSVVDLEAIGAYIEPEYTNDNELLNRQIAQLNSLANASVTYILPGREVILDGSTIMTWLDMDADGNYYKNQEKFNKKVTEFVNQMADETDSVGKEKIFLTTSGHTVTLNGKNYGWKIDREKEIAALKKNIENLDVVSREPEYSSREKHLLNNGFGFTYVEVNLSEQHLYYYVDGEIVLDSKIVSGQMTKDWYVKEGIYFLESKKRNRTVDVMRYVNGSFVKTQKASYWMGLGGELGLHDAPWRVAFGGTYYKEDGAYGTIELPAANAKKLYDLLEEDTLVVCVYNESYSLRPSEPYPTPTAKPTPKPTPIPTATPTPVPTTPGAIAQSVLEKIYHMIME